MAKGAKVVVKLLFSLLMAFASAVEVGGADQTQDQIESSTAERSSSSLESKSAETVWLTDYADGVRAARAEKSMLLIWFFEPAKKKSLEQFQGDVLADPEVRKRLEAYICVQLPVSATRPPPAAAEREGQGAGDAMRGSATRGAESLAEGGEADDEPRDEAFGHVSAPAAERLIDHPAFAELTGEPGLAILDFTDESSPNFHHVVSIYPMESRRLSTEQMIALLDLPPGSLTQRTLIWAVWTHPERPLSASGDQHEVLEREAESHSRHQAVIRVQGHHRWGSRFQKLLGRIPPGHVPQEVCAESWPGQRLIDAAEECVRSWRHSSGHWDAVRRPHPIFGYDMKRGSNGIWYATGVFGRRP